MGAFADGDGVLIRQRIQISNAIRSHMAEFGMVAAVARRHEVSLTLVYTWRRLTEAATSGSGFVDAVVTDGGTRVQQRSRPIRQ